MIFSIERPYTLLFLLFLIPTVLYTSLKFNKILKALGKRNTTRLRFAFISRTIFRALAFVFIILALSGISIGTDSIPIQKSGNSIAFVIDISYSMQTRDCPQNMTRLEAVCDYAEELLNKLENTPVSVTLAKGNGILALPVTEDYEAIKALLESLSPSLMTSAGSNLGSGIETAINSFPSQSASKPIIWLFTDGEETDDTLLASLNDAVKYGIPVCIIGFGSERESEILAGDNKTKVKTALRSDKIEKTISSVKKKNSTVQHSQNQVFYIDASQMGSAKTLLSMLEAKNNSSITSYETKPIPRHTLFTLLAIICFLLSFGFGEFSSSFFNQKNKMALSLSIIFLLTGCSSYLSQSKEMLEGRLNWNKKDYPKATANFLNVTNHAKENSLPELYDYAVFALASTYLSQDQSEAALLRYSQLTPSCPENIKAAVFYNKGIIAHQNGNYKEATELFKESLLIDSANIDAKINLELSLNELEVQSKKAEQGISPVSIEKNESALQEAIYSVIRENEKQQWKNQEQPQQTSEYDY